MLISAAMRGGKERYVTLWEVGPSKSLTAVGIQLSDIVQGRFETLSFVEGLDFRLLASPRINVKCDFNAIKLSCSLLIENYVYITVSLKFRRKSSISPLRYSNKTNRAFSARKDGGKQSQSP